MKVSFLVTYYNQEKFVRQSLDSVLAIEKPFEWEILVGDDGSSDHTVGIVNEYISKYPNNISLHVMPREKDKKYEIVKRSSANRLNLITHMTGDYFCIFDGDDYYCDTKFVIEALKVFDEFSNYSVVAFGYQKFSEERGIMSKHCLASGKIDTSDYLKNGMYTHAGACVYKNVFNKDRIEFLKEVGYYDDNDIVCNSLYFGRMYAIDKIIYSYRQTDNSTYNSMQLAEQSILNMQGYDVDVLYLPNYKNELLKRNIYSLLNVFYLRNKMEGLLGEDKYYRYFESCKNIKNSITYKILNYNNIPINEKKIVKYIVCTSMLCKPKLSLKLGIKNMLN